MTSKARWAASHLRLAVTALALLAWTFAAGAAHAGDGAQFSGDCGSTYVNKKVGSNEQWAITWEPYGNGRTNSTPMAANMATTPPNLSGMARRIA